MPKIQEYQSRVNPAGPANNVRYGETSGAMNQGIAQLGKGIEDLGEGITKHVERQEVSIASVKMAQLQDTYTTKWQDTLRDPNAANDPDLTQKFLADYDSDASKVKDELSTSGAQSHFQQQNLALRGHLFKNALQGQAELAGLQEKKNLLDSTGHTSSALIKDPSGYDIAKERLASDLENAVQSKRLTREEAIKLHATISSDYAQNSVRGSIENGPEETLANLKAGAWDSELNGDQKHTLIREAETEIRSRKVQSETDRSELKKVRKEQAELAQDEWLKSIYEGKAKVKEIVKDPRLDFQTRNQMLNIAESHSRDEMRDDPNVVNSLFNRVNLQDGDSRKIVDESELNAYVGKGISISTLQNLRKEISGTRTEEGRIRSDRKKGLFRQAEVDLVKKDAFGLADVEGVKQMNSFRDWFSEQYAEKRKQGIPDSELYNPESQHYLGKGIELFKKTPQQKIQSMLAPLKAAPKPGVPAYKPGQSAEEYLKSLDEKKDK